MISIINYGMGNIRSVQNALSFLGIDHKVISTSDEIINSQKLIIPGVGSFKKAMQNMKKNKFIDSLNEAVLDKKIPVLGICLGMQLMAEESREAGHAKGFGWISGTLEKLDADKYKIKVPHVGFNTVYFEKEKVKLYQGLKDKADFYYVHSYRLKYEDCPSASGWSKYGEKIVASVEKDNIFGTQFHPEKSQSNGLLMLKNFAELKR